MNLKIALLFYTVLLFACPIMAQEKDAYENWLKIFPSSGLSDTKSPHGRVLMYAFYFKEEGGVDVCVFLRTITTLNNASLGNRSSAIVVNGTFSNIVVRVFLHTRKGEVQFKLGYSEDELLHLLGVIAMHEVFNLCSECPRLETGPIVLDNSFNVCVRNFDGQQVVITRGSGESVPVDHLINELWAEVTKKSMSLSDTDRKKITDIIK